MEGSLLYQKDVQDALSSNLSLEELAQLFSSSKSLREVGDRYSVTVTDPVDSQVWIFTGLTEATVRAIRLVEKFGANDALFEAVKLNDLPALEALFQLGLSIHAIDKEKSSLLKSAFDHDRLEIAQRLLEKGVLVGSGQRSGEEAMKAAVTRDKIRMVQLLIDWGVLRSEPNSGPNNLYMAGALGKEQIVELLLDNRVSPNPILISNSGVVRDRPFLFLVISMFSGVNKLPVTKLLVERGADLSKLDKDGRTIFLYVLMLGERTPNNKELTEYLFEQSLLQGVNVNQPDSEGNTALMWAARDGYEELVRKLLESGADVNAKLKDGMTALIAASQNKRENIARMLIENGADINANYREQTVLMEWARYSSNLPFVQYLVEHGADINAAYHGQTILMEWIRHGGNLPFIQYLIEHGVDINAQNSRGETALSYANNLSDKTIANYLRSLGAH